MTQLEIRCAKLERLFNKLMQTNSRNEKEVIVQEFKTKNPKMEKDLEFCFEVLAGKHKLGYTCDFYCSDNWNIHNEGSLTIRKFYNKLKTNYLSQHAINEKNAMCCLEISTFMQNLCNREYKLGYSNKKAMITNLSPMLAKKYPDAHREQFYCIQEKLDGNRCIAYYDNDKWNFQSRSGKRLNVNFDMNWADKTEIYDGEIMTLGKASSRDFNRTSGAINGKYTDKSQLHYFIYDIMNDEMTYSQRYKILNKYTSFNSTFNVSNDCSILPVLDEIWVYPNPEYNYKLDYWLDLIVSKGGEGIILRDPDSVYKHTRTEALLKYKKVQTMDLRIIDWNPGKGKYMGAIGSFYCETDDGKITVNVAGMNDAIRFSNPADWIGKIIEVAYFDGSKSKNKDTSSLRFPRLKKVRYDKETTSIY